MAEVGTLIFALALLYWVVIPGIDGLIADLTGPARRRRELERAELERIRDEAMARRAAELAQYNIEAGRELQRAMAHEMGWKVDDDD